MSQTYSVLLISIMSSWEKKLVHIFPPGISEMIVKLKPQMYVQYAEYVACYSIIESFCA